MTVGYHGAMTERRSFLARLGAAAAAFGLVAPSVHAQAVSPRQPPRHAKDDWFDQLPGTHRMFFDTTSPRGAEDGAIYVNNFFTANKNGYALEDSDLALVLGFRHNSIGFAFDDAIWAKYGAAIAENAKFTDPKTGKARISGASRTTRSPSAAFTSRSATCRRIGSPA